MFTLRPNQTEPIEKAIQFFNEKSPKPSLIVLPTAWGKSILTAYVAKNSSDKILVLQPTKELLEQNYEKYITLCGGLSNAAIYSASFKSKRIAKITYATIGSIKALGATFKRLGFTKMLIDEAHLYPRESDSMLGTFLKDSGITHVLGITATPIKLQAGYDIKGNAISKLVMLTSRSKKGNFYKEILHVGQISEMLQMGFWSPLHYEASYFDDQYLEFNTRKSEYTEESVQRAYNANGGTGTIREAINAHPERKHVLVFVPSVKDAKQLAEQYKDAAVVYGDMKKKERDAVINSFRSGKTRIIFNVRVLSTGFDYTGIDLIVLGISTASIALYYQIIGRGTRIDPNKSDCVIYDLGGNVNRFGRVEDIVFEQGKIWRMFGTGGRLLSGVPIHEIGKYTRQDAMRNDKNMEIDILDVMPFGKYRGERITDIPRSYKQWMLQNFTWNKNNDKLKRSILATL